jgi:hypothetical protein
MLTVSPAKRFTVLDYCTGVNMELRPRWRSSAIQRDAAQATKQAESRLSRLCAQLVTAGRIVMDVAHAMLSSLLA